MSNRKSILIAGASGLIGTRLTELLLQKGHQVSHLGRHRKSGPVPSFTWDVMKGTVDDGAFHSADTVINLAGASLADERWTEKRKKEILQSRTKSVEALRHELQHYSNHVRTFICASAVGYYGVEDERRVHTETDKPGKDFLAFVTRQWESEVDKIPTTALRIVKLRIGIVLSDRGGALQQMAKPIKLGFGSPLGSGKQYVSWIHIDDVCNMFIKAVEDDTMQGVYNAAAPEPATNKELTHEIARALDKSIVLPRVPAFVLKMVLGEMSEMVVKGNKVSSEKIEKAGFQYQFRGLRDALNDLLKPKR